MPSNVSVSNTFYTKILSNALRHLFGQTLYYGLSSVVGRFLNYLITPVLTATLTVQDNGQLATLYATIAFLNVCFAFGMETAYFRYMGKYPESKVRNTIFTFLLLLTIGGGGLLLSLKDTLAEHMHLSGHSDYVVDALLIVCVDTLCILPFAELRYKGKVAHFVTIKLGGIFLNVALVLFFLLGLPYIKIHFPAFLGGSFLGRDGLSYVFIANLCASGCMFFLLFPVWKHFQVQCDFSFLQILLRYATPLVLIGFTGIINETLDRVMLPYLIEGTSAEKYLQTGIYAVNYKLAMLITLFIQAFRMGAEPFFFRRAQYKGAPILYAQVMQGFVVVCLFGFLVVVLFLDIWKYFINAHRNLYFAAGLKVVPILLMANICLGMYYNVSVWYKLTDRTRMGAYIALGGAIITFVGNYFFIPYFGYMACAWVTLLCYAAMLVMAYLLGQRYYPIPYALPKIVGYFLLAWGIYGAHSYFFGGNNIVGGVGLLFFVGMVVCWERGSLNIFSTSK